MDRWRSDILCRRGVGDAVFKGRILREKEVFFQREYCVYQKCCDSRFFQCHDLLCGIMLTLVQVCTLQAPNMQWQPFFSQWIAEKSNLGYLYFGISLAITAGSFLSLWLLGKMKHNEKGFLIASQAVMGVGMILAGITGSFFLALSTFLLHEFARGLFEPIKNDYVNQSIPEKTRERSILLSIESMSHHIGGAVGLIASGLVAKYLSIPITWVIFGGFLIIVTLLISRKGKK